MVVWVKDQDRQHEILRSVQGLLGIDIPVESSVAAVEEAPVGAAAAGHVEAVAVAAEDNYANSLALREA